MWSEIAAAYSVKPMEGLIENTYTIKIINKSQQDQTFMLKFTGLAKANWIGEQEVTIKGGDTAGCPSACRWIRLTALNL